MPAISLGGASAPAEPTKATDESEPHLHASFWSTQREAMARKAFKTMLQLGDGGEALEGKGPGRNRFLFLAPQGDTPVRITHFRVGGQQCQFGGRRHARAKRAARRSAKREIRVTILIRLHLSLPATPPVL